jgi:predicted DNA-binding WGR domain protein
MSRISFATFLLTAFDKGDYSTDDAIAFVLPLFRKVIGFHEAGLVAPFENEQALIVTAGLLDIEDALAHAPVNSLYRVEGESFFLPGYGCFEQRAGHHDPQSDIFCLGLILGGMAMGLDLYDKEDLALFVRNRNSPCYHHPRVHPSLGRLITLMTEPDRNRREPDLYEVIRRLEHYRDYDAEEQTDLSMVAGWMHKDLKQRDAYILNKLRNRLFDTSRRNRLLYYKPNSRFVNLTAGSVPLVLHDSSIRPELLLTWHGEFSEKMIGMKELLLNKYLRFEDYNYLPASLDGVRIAARRDIQEYGFSQLKLVIAFLYWNNLKEDPTERIRTPLLLLPADLKKNKKVKEDHFVLKVSDNVAEVNPVLAGQLAALYGIRLPDFIDLEEMSPAQFYTHVRTQIEAAGQGIVLHYLDKPDIRRLSEQARQAVRYGKKKRPSGWKILGIYPGIWRGPRPPLTGSDNRKPADPDTPDPHTWEFDVCNIVLGNFHYKKMSLVRDYNVVMDQQLRHHVFDELFDEQPKIFPDQAFDGNRPDDWYHVITADPTQTRAILQSRAGYSYIIQGPPGTGKSQTITNLIADFVARGLSILFVCEKRAALDVVYHRLKQVGLDELCCYIHDSQGDKREFIKNLKSTYEDFVLHKTDLALLRDRRQEILDKMNGRLDLIREYHDTSNSDPGEAGIDTRSLIERLLLLRAELTTITPQQEEILPSYREWREAATVLATLAAFMEETGADPVFSAHPFSHVKEEIFFSANPHRVLSDTLAQALAALDEVNAHLQTGKIDALGIREPGRLSKLVQFSVLLQPLARRGMLALADPNREEAKAFERRLLNYRQLQETHRRAMEITARWTNKPDEQDLDNALALATRYENSFFGSLNGSWRNCRKQLQQRYEFSGLSVRPSYTSLLDGLKREYAAAARVGQVRDQLQTDYAFDNIDTAWRSIDLLQSKKGNPDLDYLVQHPDSKTLVDALQALHQPLSRLDSLLQRCLQDPPPFDPGFLRDELLTLRLNVDALGQWLPVLRAFSGLSPAIKQPLRQLPLRIPQLEAAAARKTLQGLYQTNRAFYGIDYLALGQAGLQLGEGYAGLQAINAAIIRAFVRQRFVQRLDLSTRAASQLNEEQKKFKKTYTEGRKILENEFGKSMRYKSIRELSEKESGTVLKDIKPIWLMSPYSVSDSLPLDSDHFDVVIFDEASQITLEEGVPALYRSRQAIIVGDEKQMPPSDFFSAGSKDNDPDDLDKADGLSRDEWLSDDADSLLVQGSRKLVSTLLSWHYRSHYETLISYSNHAFYEGDLLTIPDKTIHHREKLPIRVAGPEDAALQTASLFDRSISFHFLTNSIYENRSNAAEAGYIARLVRELLGRGIRESIGIVAFSQEQQHAIEEALDELAVADAGFAQVLEEAFNRMENDQFVGLIVKNLENVQGDERDIIIMSVCYGFDANRRILMNFGPVNKRGGEKRLNVLFSRAKMHMAVVSSIRYEHITNEFNEGANYLRRFLQYAELISEGRMAEARTVLDGLAPRKLAGAVVPPTVIREQLKQQLVALGYEVAEEVGQSGFKCSLAVKSRPEDEDYSLAILIDDERHYHNNNLIEQYSQRPAILRRFGWKVLAVYGRDWLHQPQKVVEQIVKELGHATKQTDTVAAEAGREGVVRMILRDAGGEKFWEAATDGNTLIIRLGKTGSRGQISLKTFPDSETALNELNRLEGEQGQKGYSRV